MKKRLPGTIIAGLTLAMAVAGAALAVESGSEPDADAGTDAGAQDVGTVAPMGHADQSQVEVTTSFDDDSGILVISVGDGEADPCADGMVTAERNEDGEIVVMIDGVPLEEGQDLPDGCLVFDGIGKNGKINHGTVVSSVASGLDPHELDVPKGWIVREVAKSNHGKGAKGDDDGTDGEGDGDTDGGGVVQLSPLNGHGNGHGNGGAGNSSHGNGQKKRSD